MTTVSKLASVSPKAKIGHNVIIEPFTTIYEDVEIGDNTWIGTNVTIFSGTRIGSDCKIFPSTTIGAIPQDLKFHGEYTTVEIGNHTNIRECVTINRGTEESNKTTVGDNCLLMAYVHVAHDCVVGNHCILSNGTQLAGHVQIEDWVIFGGMSGALQKTRIGKHSFVSGTTFVGRDVLPYSKIMYTPGNYAGINKLGLLRRGFTREQMQQVSDIFKSIYYSDFNLSQATEYIKQNFIDTEFKKDILNFMSKTINGIILKTTQDNE